MWVKEESEKDALKVNIQKTKIMASGPITSWQIDGEIMETLQQEQPPQWEVRTLELESNPCSPQLKKARLQQLRSRAANN